MTNIGSPWKEGRRLGTLEERDRTQRYLKLVKEEYWKEGDIKACQLDVNDHQGPKSNRRGRPNLLSREIWLNRT